MKLLPIKAKLEDNAQFINHPDCKETLERTIDYYQIIGYQPPWVGYYAEKDNNIVGSLGFKGGPKDGKVEIAYVTFEKFRKKGMGTEMCKALVSLAQESDPAVIITARTLAEKNFSTRILEKNGFEWVGVVQDEQDGDVWEWRYKK